MRQVISSQFTRVLKGKMKTLLSLVTLSVFLTEGLAYDCPLEGVNFEGSDLGIQRDVQSWEGCGKKGTSTLISIVRDFYVESCGVLVYFIMYINISYIFRRIVPSPSRGGLPILDLE